MSASQPQSFQRFSFGTQVRKSPFSDAALRWGAQGFSVYNHMYIPRDFGDPVQNFWNLVNEAILCDVAVERQVEITGPAGAVTSRWSPQATVRRVWVRGFGCLWGWQLFA